MGRVDLPGFRCLFGYWKWRLAMIATGFRLEPATTTEAEKTKSSGNDSKGNSLAFPDIFSNIIPSWIDKETKCELRQVAKRSCGRHRHNGDKTRHVPQGYRDYGKTGKPGKLHEELAASLDRYAKTAGRLRKTTSHLHAAA